MSTHSPRIELVEPGKLNLKDFSIFALPISQKNQKPLISNQSLKKTLEKEFELNLQTALKNWPDFTGKSGEIVELPINKTGYKASRIYLVGVGEEIGRAHV